jgi:CBS domain-containing protein
VIDQFRIEEERMTTALQMRQSSYVGPSFDNAKVHDAMRVGVVTCRPQTSLRDVARIMVGYQIHSVVVDDLQASMHPWAIVCDLDIANAAKAKLDDLTAGDVARSELVTVPADETLARAAQLMSEHGVSHLMAVQRFTGQPIGVISALGLASVLAAGS